MKRAVVFAIVFVAHITAGLCQQSCFDIYKQAGDKEVALKHWHNAIKQFQAAKQCDLLSYTQIHFLDSLINVSYAKWVNELETAKKNADKFGLESLMSGVHDKFINGEYATARSTLLKSSYNNNPEVKAYLNELKDYVPDVTLKNVLDYTFFSAQGKDYIFFLRESKKKHNPKKSDTKQSQLQSDGNDRTQLYNYGTQAVKKPQAGIGTAANSVLLALEILDVSGEKPKKIITKEYEVPNTSDPFVNRLYLRLDSIRNNIDTLSPVDFDRLLTVEAEVEKSDEEAENETGPEILSMPKESLDTLAAHGIHCAFVTVTDTIEGKVVQTEVFIIRDTTRNKGFSLKNVYRAQYVSKLNKVVFETKAKGFYIITILSLPLFDTFTVSKLSLNAPDLYYLSVNPVLTLKIPSENSASQYTFFDVSNNRFIPNILKSENESYPYVKKYGDHYVYENKEGVIVINNAFQQLHAYAEYPRSAYNEESGIMTIHKIVYDKAYEKILGDTLLTLNLKTNKEAWYYGKKINLNAAGTFATVIKDSSVEVLDFLHPEKLSALKITYNAPVTIERLGEDQWSDQFVWLNVKPKKGEDTIMLLSLKSGARLFESSAVLSNVPSRAVFCATYSDVMQVLYYIDTVNSTVQKDLVFVEKHEVKGKDIEYSADKNVFYAVNTFYSGTGAGEGERALSDETEEDESAIATTPLQKIKKSTTTTIFVYNVKTRKSRRIKSTENIYLSDIHLTGDFLMFRQYGYFNQTYSLLYPMFKIPGTPGALRKVPLLLPPPMLRR